MCGAHCAACWALLLLSETTGSQQHPFFQDEKAEAQRRWPGWASNLTVPLITTVAFYTTLGRGRNFKNSNKELTLSVADVSGIMENAFWHVMLFHTHTVP